MIGDYQQKYEIFAFGNIFLPLHPSKSEVYLI